MDPRASRSQSSSRRDPAMRVEGEEEFQEEDVWSVLREGETSSLEIKQSKKARRSKGQNSHLYLLMSLIGARFMETLRATKGVVIICILMMMMMMVAWFLHMNGLQERLEIKHVKGMLLFGPPGTGKTLMARQIGKMLNGKDPKIVNGPEVRKFVGETEKNVRDLFADAEQDQRTLGKKKLFSLICVFFFYVCANEALLFYFSGDASELHVIIFDEIDAICKSRGSTRDGTGVHDSIVNQLLTKVSQRSWILLIFVNSVFSRMWLPLLFQIDGVEALNNVLLIGMTNRKDLLDEALLRPGRLEVQVEISLPDEAGRFQILQIHTNKMKEISFLGHDINLQELAARTKNYSGAELEGVVKSATSYALNRQLGMDDLTKPVEEKNIKITMEDFLHAIHEVQPGFGASTDDLDIAAMVNASEVKHEPAQCLFSLKLPNCKSMPFDTRQPELQARCLQPSPLQSLLWSHHDKESCGKRFSMSDMRKPDSWKLNEIFATGIVLGGYQAVMSVIFFWVIHKTDFCSDKFGVRSIRDNNDELMFAVYLQVSNISQALIFVTRSRSWSFVERPGALLMIAFVIATGEGYRLGMGCCDLGLQYFNIHPTRHFEVCH
ncbi:unnamed protein product [Brassica oleracea]